MLQADTRCPGETIVPDAANVLAMYRGNECNVPDRTSRCYVFVQFRELTSAKPTARRLASATTIEAPVGMWFPGRAA
jgi:hypothetical protein